MPKLFKMTLTRRGKDFRKIGPNVEARLVNAQYSTAVDLLQTARRYARERTGEMKRKITVVQTGPLAYSIEARAAHSMFNEYGTRFMSAQPFMRPAVADVLPRAEDRVIAALKAEVE